MKDVHVAKAENTYENSGGGSGVFGWFSRVINKAYRKSEIQRAFDLLVNG